MKISFVVLLSLKIRQLDNTCRKRYGGADGDGLNIPRA